MNTSERMKKMREIAGLSQEELAEQIGVGVNTIWRWEAGRATPARYIKKLAAVLNTTPAYLLGIDAPTPPADTPTTTEQTLIFKNKEHQIQIPATPEGYKLYREIITAMISSGKIGEGKE